MTIAVLDTHTLMGVVQTLRPPQPYWLKLCFPSVQLFDSEYIDFDVIEGGRRVAPFVAPNVQGKVMSELGHTTKRFKPAYVKPKNIVTPDRAFKRRAGEAYGGSLSPAARVNAVIASILSDHNDMHIRRRELMAFSAIANGSVTVAGENYPSQTVDFGRDGTHTVNLTGADRWSESTSEPLVDIEAWLVKIQRKAGAVVNRLTMGTDAYSAFISHADVKEQLEIRRIADPMNLNLGPGNGEAAQYKGTLGNGLEVWVYSDIYQDDDGTDVEIMDSRDVILTSASVDGVQCYGAILDADAGYVATDIFAKMWKDNDPSAIFLMTQSAPLMVPTRPNATLKARVLNAA
jgi:hypothetical protein